MTIWRMSVAGWIPKATNTYSEYSILIFNCNSGCTNAPQCYVIRTLAVLLIMKGSELGVYAYDCYVSGPCP